MFLKFCNTPNNEVNPTINKLYAIDTLGSILNKYVNIGTTNIEPPQPKIPKLRPINIGLNHMKLSFFIPRHFI